LISLIFFLLNLSSICHGEALVRLRGPWGPTSQQSYPQLLWAMSYDTEVHFLRFVDARTVRGREKSRSAAKP
jgi:hypothetical protein